MEPTTQENAEEPVVTGYLDYRVFLREYFAWQKVKKTGVSLRKFAAHSALGLKSSSFLTAVLQGKKNLSQPLRLGFVRAMGLEYTEAEYFDFLVQFNQAKTLEEKNFFFARLSKFRGSRARVLHDTQYEFFSKWYYSVLWNYFALPGAARHPSQIAKHLHPALTPEQVEDAIKFLLDLGLLRKMANGYTITDRHLATDREFSSLVAKPYNLAFIELAKSALENFPASERQFNVMAFSISEKGFKAVKERVESFRQEVREIIERDQGMDRVCAMNLQIFPAAKLDRE
jgi:uncharacterized protein (TIGR02147 family)